MSLSRREHLTMSLATVGQAGVVTTAAKWQELVDQFGNVYDVSELAGFGELLPSGFEAYTCVVHALIDKADVLTRYSDTPPLTWDRVRTVQHQLRHERDGWLLASEGNLDEVSAPILIEMLGIGGDAPDYIVTPTPASSAFGRPWSEISGNALARLLNDRHLGPVLWFPKTVEWICATPWDEWQTYIASSIDLATHLHHHPDLETVSSLVPDL